MTKPLNSMSGTATEQQKWAELYMGLGLNPIPVHYVKADGSCSCRQGEKCPSPGKHPALDSWLRYQRVRANEDDAEYWFDGPFKSHNVGIVTGKISGGLVVIDVDAGEGKDGDETLQTLQLENDDLPDTMMAYTGGGGRHYFFYAPKGMRIKTGTNILGPGVDVRGEGGFVVAAPSQHKSGRPYTMEVSSPIAELPDWLAEILAAQWGDKFAEEAAALNQPASIDLRVNTLKGDCARALQVLKKDKIEAEATAYSPLGLRLKIRVNLQASTAFKGGFIEIQDEGSQLIALLVDTKADMKTIDGLPANQGRLALADSRTQLHVYSRTRNLYFALVLCTAGGASKSAARKL